jgi:23S rRNA (cytosine1962-C5)-methyltransferase
MSLPVVTLRAGHVQPVWAGHPWIYRQAIASMTGAPTIGDEVEVRDARGNRLGRGFYSPDSAIPIKLATRDPDQALDHAWFEQRIARAVMRRRAHHLPDESTTAFRLINSEGDGIPGLTVDCYGDIALAQLATAGIERRADLVVNALRSAAGVGTVVALPVGGPTRAEHLATDLRVLCGTAPDVLVARERGFEWHIPFGTGQKTGFFADQRPNRARVEYLARGRRVLDLCCYAGGFALAAARGGASRVLAVDSSEPALELGRDAAQRAGLDAVEWLRSDVREVLHALGERGESFDLVILDPPKLARGARDLQGALGRYAELNRLALGVLADAGMLVSCSCSGAVTLDLFLRTLARAGAEVGIGTTVVDIAGAGPDHPSPPAFAEGRYLKVVSLERL